MRSAFSKKHRPDPELVESCVYQINADKARCNYLIRAIKARSPEAAPRQPRGNAGETQPQGESKAAGACGDEEDNAVWT